MDKRFACALAFLVLMASLVTVSADRERSRPEGSSIMSSLIHPLSECFSLDKGEIRGCLMEIFTFSTYASKLRIEPKEGDEIMSESPQDRCARLEGERQERCEKRVEAMSERTWGAGGTRDQHGRD